MAKYEQRRWPGNPSGMGAAARRGGPYKIYRPDLLTNREFPLVDATLNALEDAAGAVSALETHARVLADSEALGRLMLRAESVGSSRIEGLEVGPRRLLRAELARQDRIPIDDGTAREVLGNVNAMTWAIANIHAGDDITLDHLLDIHRALMSESRTPEIAGQLRTTQNWIGGQDPPRAAYVPPPPADVPGLMGDLVRFVNACQLPFLATAAIAHAQFETIHPFADGNGRTGRALIHMVLRRGGLIEHVGPPISLILATNTAGYIEALTRFRYDGQPTSEAATTGADAWVRMFAACAAEACEQVARFERAVDQIRTSWRERLGSVRSDAAVFAVLDTLPAAPVLSASSAQSLTGRSVAAIHTALQRLLEAGIIKQITVGRRNRAFEAPEIIQAFTLFERRLGSPAGNTSDEPPARHTPARPEVISDAVRDALE